GVPASLRVQCLEQKAFGMRNVVLLKFSPPDRAGVFDFDYPCRSNQVLEWNRVCSWARGQKMDGAIDMSSSVSTHLERRHRGRVSALHGHNSVEFDGWIMGQGDHPAIDRDRKIDPFCCCG